MKKTFTAIVISLMMLGSANSAFSSNNESAGYAVQIPAKLGFAWLGGPGAGNVLLTGANAITMAEMLAGEKSGILGGTLECDTNVSFDLYVNASGANFVPLGTSVKSTSDIYVSIAGGPDMQLNGTSDVLLATALPTGYFYLGVIYKVDFSSADRPDTYSTVLTYTVVPN
jgi:hypothetical protein